ncbi:DnaB-like helicase C-terminal domain-containing protein [Cellulomonas sp. ES6]|uniref:replicative DNA helicase n=1 Tax=Cellulomonas sp. ES6 TaxID=3039384 RepID=UPI0024B84BBE|nr:DnaB-like helicase C-terminal domain-containing protein [Cellulomonas sp. ES6]WHP18820.1 DnaB-like helicase C-terminal domain-containing protein [Cellulomonas sp. ES6]
MNDLHPERAVIGLAMAKPGIVDGLDVDVADFGTPANAAVWRVITRLRDRGEPTDPASVVAAVETTRGTDMDLNAVDALWIHQVYSEAPIAALGDRYARLVADYAARRRLGALFIRGNQMLSEVENAAEIVEILRGELDAVTRGTAAVRLVGDTIADTLDAIAQPSAAIPTPWSDLNDLIRGWRPGALYVVAARPGVGKSIVAIDAALGLAEHGYVAINSLEMPETELHGRLLANLAEVPVGRIDGRALQEADWARISRRMDILTGLRISIDDRSGISLTDVKSHARTLSRRGPVSGLVVDYLQLMEAAPGDRRPRHELIASYSRGLKVLAKEMNIPVIALSQLNRGPEQRQDKRPSLGDLRESGAIEQDADVVLLLHETNLNDDTELDVIVAKNRHGARGDFQVVRRGWYSRIDQKGWTPHRTA